MKNNFDCLIKAKASFESYGNKKLDRKAVSNIKKWLKITLEEELAYIRQMDNNTFNRWMDNCLQFAEMHSFNTKRKTNG